MTYRYLRHLTVKRLFALPGMDEYKVSQLVSTSVQQLQKTYGQLYKAAAVSTVHDAIPEDSLKQGRRRGRSGTPSSELAASQHPHRKRQHDHRVMKEQ